MFIDRLLVLLGGLVAPIAGLGFLWHPLFAVAGGLIGAWVVTYVVVIVLGLGGWLLNVLGFEIRRKR